MAEQFPGADPQVENSSSDLGIEDRISEKATIALTNRVPTSRSALPSTPRRPTGPATVPMIIVGLTLVLVLSLLIAIVMARHLTAIADRVSRGDLENRIEDLAHWAFTGIKLILSETTTEKVRKNLLSLRA